MCRGKFLRQFPRESNEDFSIQNNREERNEIANKKSINMKGGKIERKKKDSATEDIKWRGRNKLFWQAQLL